MWSMRSVDHFPRKGQPNKVQNSRLKFRDRHNSVLSKSYKAYKFQGILFHKPMNMFPRQILYYRGDYSTSRTKVHLVFHVLAITQFVKSIHTMGDQDNGLSSYESPLGFSRSCYHTRHKIDSHSSKHHTTDVRTQIILINFPQIGQFWTFSHYSCVQQLG